MYVSQGDVRRPISKDQYLLANRFIPCPPGPHPTSIQHDRIELP